jgi:hypothetical protein
LFTKSVKVYGSSHNGPPKVVLFFSLSFYHKTTRKAPKKQGHLCWGNVTFLLREAQYHWEQSHIIDAKHHLIYGISRNIVHLCPHE